MRYRFSTHKWRNVTIHRCASVSIEAIQLIVKCCQDVSFVVNVHSNTCQSAIRLWGNQCIRGTIKCEVRDWRETSLSAIRVENTDTTCNSTITQGIQRRIWLKPNTAVFIDCNTMHCTPSIWVYTGLISLWKQVDIRPILSNRHTCPHNCHCDSQECIP